jgi:hypothetical protein
MCIACEMGFWDMVDQLSPEAREKFLREEAARLAEPFACDVPEQSTAPDATPPSQGERKP